MRLVALIFFILCASCRNYGEDVRDVFQIYRIPNDVINVRVFSDYALDRYDYVYFEGNTSEVDRFAKDFVQKVPLKNNGISSLGEISESWWISTVPDNYRSERSNLSGQGVREIVIVDLKNNISKVWISASGAKNFK